MIYGFAAYKDIGLSNFAEYITSNFPVVVLAYNNRYIGASYNSMLT
jgi:hypothetical protein